MLTIKGLSTGIACGEWEYAIPLADAQALLDQVCQQPLIEKNRYRILAGIWSGKSMNFLVTTLAW
jgi:adenylate cyclase